MGRECRLWAVGIALSLLLCSQAGEARADDWRDKLFGRTTQPQTYTRELTAREKALKQPEQAAAELQADDLPLSDDATLQGLEAAIQRYQQIAASGGWPQIRPGKHIRPEEEDERLPALRRRLRISGDYQPRQAGREGSIVFDAELEEAVRRFQTRHGIRPSGIVDKPTFDALNIPAEVRVAQLKVNVIRVRELLTQTASAERYILVNVPGYALEAVERTRVVGRHRTIVGKPDRQTPSVKALIKNLNFYPSWHVPESVAHKDLIPRLQKDPEYLRREHIRILTAWRTGQEIPPEGVDWTSPQVTQYKFQQEPGPWNALGLVRIDMPNEHAVYMHDTPMKHLFSQRGRAYSAGCVRVEGVFDLVTWLARDVQGWDRQRIEDVLSEGVPVDVQLPRPVAVHFVYITAWVSGNGRIEFRPDIYGRDGTQSLIAGYDPQPVAPTLSP